MAFFLAVYGCPQYPEANSQADKKMHQSNSSGYFIRFSEAAV